MHKKLAFFMFFIENSSNEMFKKCFTEVIGYS